MRTRSIWMSGGSQVILGTGNMGIIKVYKLWAAGLALALFLPVSAARAEMEVLESSAPGIEVGSTLNDRTRLKLPEGSTVRLLVKTSGGSSTKTLKGPYDGTAANYRERRRWFHRLTRRKNEQDPPMAAHQDEAPAIAASRRPIREKEGGR
jgi:hypothetical protein